MSVCASATRLPHARLRLVREMALEALQPHAVIQSRALGPGRSDRVMPRKRGPAATLSRTFFHGRQASLWKDVADGRIDVCDDLAEDPDFASAGLLRGPR